MARPRSFDLDDALAAATKVFLSHGFDGATLEDLTGAMGVNKPSLYAAFGDKSALYARVLGGYAAMAKSAMKASLEAGHGLEEASRELLRGAIEIYAPAQGSPLGCLIATTATTAAGSDPAIRAEVAAFLSDVDRLIARTIERRFAAELAEAGVAPVALVLSATLYSLAIRARAGASRRQLSTIAERAVETIGALARAHRPAGRPDS